jgi:Fe-S cluster assembly protein SufB
MSQVRNISINSAKHSFRDSHHSVYRAPKGLNEKVVKYISQQKNEPAWLLDMRLRALAVFFAKPMPNWGGDLALIDFSDIYYYIKPAQERGVTWGDVPKKIKKTFDRLGIPQAERKFLAGVGAQYESEMIYHSLKDKWAKLGVIFADMSEAPTKYPELVKKYFGKIIPLKDNKFSALNTAVWSGGSFIYIPKGVKVEVPLQAYFRINAAGMGQFERTLIIADEGSSVHYIEGCTAPMYSRDSLHAAVVELVALKGAHIRYTTIQNWSQNVYNLVTKRAWAEEEAVVEWIDGNLGSKLTMKYPCVVLKGRKSRAEIISVAFAGQNQHQDAGSKVIHLAPETSSNVIAKSIAKGNGRTSYRGLVQVAPQATKAKVKVKCDALLIDRESRSDTYPTMRINNDDVSIEHEATVAKIGEQQLYYLNSRGLDTETAERLIVSGFFEVFARELPMEYALELNRLLAMEMEGSVG